MDFDAKVQVLRAGKTLEFPPEANTLEYAKSLDAQDKLSHLREQFIIPTKGSLKKEALDGTIPNATTTPQTNGTASAQDDSNSPSIYFVGNSLGAQPKLVRQYLDNQLETWASIGVAGHFTDLDNSPLPNWQDLSASCAAKSAPLVGASPSEVVIMNTLTANLHFMMASFYKPTPTRHEILLEWKPFPSDWYAIQSQIEWHGLDPATSMVEMQPDSDFILYTEKILATIDEHADSAALLLLPGIQYYSGQFFDIPTITAYAQKKGLVVGWDLAHAAGNVPLKLHDWNVDFACWCTYKYMNAGPGAIAGVFVHERHGGVRYPLKAEGGEEDTEQRPEYRHRLSGWYGGDKRFRFEMGKLFRPTAGAAGFQCSNPSAIDLSALSAALTVFGMTSMEELRSKALLLTAYAERLLDGMVKAGTGAKGGVDAFRIITPRNPLERGTQLSLLLREGLLERVSGALTENGIVCDKRKPDVIRVAPVPMYCTFEEVWRFMRVFEMAIRGD